MTDCMVHTELLSMMQTVHGTYWIRYILSTVQNLRLTQDHMWYRPSDGWPTRLWRMVQRPFSRSGSWGRMDCREVMARSVVVSSSVTASRRASIALQGHTKSSTRLANLPSNNEAMQWDMLAVERRLDIHPDWYCPIKTSFKLAYSHVFDFCCHYFR